MIKSRFDVEFLSVRLGMVFARLRITANAWTVSSIIPAVLGFAALYYGDLALGLLLFFVSGFIDAIDGAVARVTRSVSALGAFLDGVIDRYVEVLLYLGLMFYLADKPQFLLPAQVWIVLLVYGAIMPSFVRAYADHRKVVTDQGDLRKMGGLLERAERLTIIYIGMLAGLYDPLFLAYAVAATAALANVTAVQRIWFVLRYRA